MSIDSILLKINNGEEISTSELGLLLVGRFDQFKREIEDDINRLASVTMAEFEKLRQEMETGFESVRIEMSTKEELKNAESRLSKRIDFNNEKTAKRLDWVESKLSKLA